MGWSDWPSWLKGGVIAALFYLIVIFILQLIGFMNLSENYSYPIEFFLGMLTVLFGYFLLVSLTICPRSPIFCYEFMYYFLAFIFYFLIGAIIGFIIGKIKSRGENKQ
jgi:hypothetical protein